jgi:hypothetical protein
MNNINETDQTDQQVVLEPTSPGLVPDQPDKPNNQTTRIVDNSKKLWDRYQIAVMQERPFFIFFLPDRVAA